MVVVQYSSYLLLLNLINHFPSLFRWAKCTVSPSVLSTLLPGPVTLILERLPTLPAHFNPNTNLVGVRVPDCELVQVTNISS